VRVVNFGVSFHDMRFVTEISCFHPRSKVCWCKYHERVMRLLPQVLSSSAYVQEDLAQNVDQKA
jgi:hypothetical protein